MRLSDLDAVMEIERLSFRHPWSRQSFIEELRHEWAHLDLVCALSREGERIVAFANYWLVHDEVHLLNLAVHPDARGAGHAKRLMAHLADFAHRNRCLFVTLEVRRSNRSAIKLYRSFGFRAVGIRPNYYAEDHEDAIVMILELEG